MTRTNALARLKRRLDINGPGITIGVIALIFALTGAAFAASGGLSGKQKKEVTAIAKKFAGKPGAPGANGAPGTAGAPGAKGAAGGAGSEGPAGKSVSVTEVPIGEVECSGRGGTLIEKEDSGTPVEVCTGEKGATGPEGVCSTAGCTLPTGVVEQGTWGFDRSVEKFTVEVGGNTEEITVGDSEVIRAPISFSIPMSAALTPEKVHYSTEGTFGTFCEGSAAAPKPKNSGELCVYENTGSNVAGTTFEGIYKPTSTISEANRGANRGGALLVFAKPTADAHGSGTFGLKG